MNCRLGIFLLQLFYERFQRRLLLGGSRVLRLAILGKPADVAYSDAHGVVPLAMGTNLFYGTANVDAAVTINHEMITDAEKATLTVLAVDVGYGVVATFLGRTAMNDDFLNLTHDNLDF